jgi:hypothetical protein
MKTTRIQFITRTALMLAVTVVIQMATRGIPAPAGSFVTGSLVNACLLIATALGGIWSGIVISILAPYTSLINNHAAVAPALVFFGPIVALGNAALVTAFYFFRKNANSIVRPAAGIIIGTAVKFLILYGGILAFFQVLASLGAESLLKFKVPMTLLFSYPQIVTALIGGALALTAIQLLHKPLKLQ